MATAGKRLGADEREFLAALKHFKRGGRFLAVHEVDAHPAGTELPDRLVYGARIVGNPAMRGEPICFFDCAAEKLVVEAFMRGRVFGEKHHAAYFLVKTMDHKKFLAILRGELRQDRVLALDARRDGGEVFRLVRREHVAVFEKYLDHGLYRLELQFVEFVIHAFFCKQGSVAALLDDFPVLKH